MRLCINLVRYVKLAQLTVHTNKFILDECGIRINLSSGNGERDGRGEDDDSELVSVGCRLQPGRSAASNHMTRTTRRGRLVEFRCPAWSGHVMLQEIRARLREKQPPHHDQAGTRLVS